MNITRIIKETKPDEIFNLAAQSHVKKFWNPEYTANADAWCFKVFIAIRVLGLEKS